MQGVEVEAAPGSAIEILDCDMWWKWESYNEKLGTLRSPSILIMLILVSRARDWTRHSSDNLSQFSLLSAWCLAGLVQNMNLAKFVQIKNDEDKLRTENNRDEEKQELRAEQELR